MALFLSGFLMGAISANGKYLVPVAVDQSFAFQGGCVFFGSALLSIGLFLSIYGLCSRSSCHRSFIFPCVCNLSLIVLTLSIYSTSYLRLAHASIIAQGIGEEPGGLPKLIQKLNTVDSEKARITIARGAYSIYGVRLAYPAQDGKISFYEPTPEEVSSQKADADIAPRILSEKTAWQDRIQRALLYAPYFFAIYLGTFFLTLLIGSLCVAIRKPSAEPNLEL